MEFCTEYDDGAYFAHLERQLLMLMMDEDDEFMSVSPVAASDDNSSSALLRKQMNSLDSLTSCIENSPPTITNDCKRLPAYSRELPKRESSGTGVFIPQMREQTTRKGKKGKVIYANRSVSARASGRRKN